MARKAPVRPARKNKLLARLKLPPLPHAGESPSTYRDRQVKSIIFPENIVKN